MLLPRTTGRQVTLLMGIALLLLSACSSGGGGSVQTPQPSPPSAKLVKLADCTQLETKLKTELAKVYQRQGLYYYYGALRLGGNISTLADTASAAPSGSAAPQATATTSAAVSTATGAAPVYSTTNVQEAGVDEGDLVKTDGNFIYLARGSHFLVLNALPADQTSIVKDIDLQEQINELHLANGRVTLITSAYNSAMATTTLMGIAGPVAAPYNPVTRLYFYDVSTPAAPSLAAKYDFPGYMQGSRRIDNNIYLVTNIQIRLPNPVSPMDYLSSATFDENSFKDANSKAMAENLLRINALTLADLLPTYSRTLYTNGTAGTPTLAPAVDCSDISIPETANGTDLSLVFVIDTSSTAPAVSSSGVISSWCSIYMSTDSLYLTSTNSWYWIEPVAGIAQTPVNPEPSSTVHKFSIAGGVKPVYRGSGVVNGWLNNQFSMGDYNGYLRVGTSRGGWWGENVSNQLAVLGELNGNLVQTGIVEGIAPGERIYAMRFDRDHGYMVTYRRTDPLFTFDLSDPKNPRKVGEIAVTGFATYIQVIGGTKNRLLTVGQSADATGHINGNKLQLFDVTNPATPLLLGAYELGSGWSTALYDYHAFLYFEPLGLLTIPYYSYGTAGSYSSGLRVFAVTDTGFTDRGAIPAQAISTDFGSYLDTVDRAVIIGNDIYSIAHDSVTVAGAAQLNIEKVVTLPILNQIYVYNMGVLSLPTVK